MVFNSTILVVGIAIGFLVWLGIISALLIRMISHYNRLSKGVTSVGLMAALESVLTNVSNLKSRAAILEKATQGLEIDGSLHVQRIGIVRFNPFADTGGAQSFSIALLTEGIPGLL